MVVDKEILKKKLLKAFDIDDRKQCSICRKTIARYDIENKNFEYVKNKLR